MIVMLITALQAAETLARFHREQADKMPPGSVREHNEDMARRCLADVDDIKHEILASGDMIEHQADTMRRRDMEAAQRIIDRHVIMHGVGLPADDVPAARVAIARDIADALAAERSGTTS